MTNGEIGHDEGNEFMGIHTNIIHERDRVFYTNDLRLFERMPIDAFMNRDKQMDCIIDSLLTQ